MCDVYLTYGSGKLLHQKNFIFSRKKDLNPESLLLPPPPPSVLQQKNINHPLFETVNLPYSRLRKLQESRS